MTRSDGAGPPLPRGFAGLGRRRITAAVVLLVAGLGALVLARGPVRELDYAVPVLLAVLLVVAVALLGGLRVALPGAVAAVLVLNWFVTPPFGTLSISSPEQVLVLLVFLVVAAGVSAVVDVAARRHAEAMRARAEAQALSELVDAALARHRSLEDILGQVRQVFGVREAALLERSDGHWEAVATSGDQQTGDDDTELSVSAGDGLMLRVSGPELFAADRRVLVTFADAAAGALQARRVAARAAEAAQLAAADRMRASLLAGVGHDLRTPLAAVKAAVSSLRQDDVAWTADERADLLATIEGGADRLQGLVANLLDASRLEAGVVSTTLERVRLEELVGRALLGLGGMDRVVLDIPEDLPDVRTDVGLAERVLVNVLENALRHGGDGEVTVRGSATDRAVVCEVVDHGPGVPPAQWATLFVPFAGADGRGPGTLGDRGTGSLGLGLAVAHGFAQAIGAGLEPAGTQGGGLTMRLTLERAP
jgi:two-component system sensor histidine kinase KdpD